MKKMKTAIILPAYNEQKNIAPVIKKAKKHGKVIVVDDGSKDKTAKIAKKAGAEVLKHKRNRGKGAAMRTGCDRALKLKAETIILLDSDGQHNPKKIPTLKKALKGKDIAFTYRKKRKEMPIFFRIGNWGLSKITFLLFGIYLKDTQFVYRAFTPRAYKKIRWKSDGFSADNEMIARTAKNNLKYTEIPLETIYLDESKGTGFFHGLKIAFDMLKYKISF